MQVLTRRFSTGLPFLDQRIDGGIPIQSIVAFIAPPVSQAQMFLREVTGTQPRHLISTNCPDEEELRGRFDSNLDGQQETTVTYAPPAELVESPTNFLEKAAPESFVIIDAADRLEQASHTEYAEFLSEFKQWIRTNDSVAFLHCHNTPKHPPRRSVTLNRADQIWNLQMQLLSKDVANRLYVTKARNSRALSEPVPLILTDHVRVDTTRNI